tara:strand:+ start:412 stop:696 length:285 start_codon:yes stop_codon:yes gene_type:complete
MKLLKNLLTLVIILIVFGYGVLFSIYNDQNVELDFIFLDSLPVPLSIWSGGLIMLGTMLGLLIGSASKMLQGIENKRLQKELKNAKTKLEKLNH